MVVYLTQCIYELCFVFKRKDRSTDAAVTALHSQAQEALRRAKFKFPGRQKVVASRNWGFTPYSRDDYVQWKKEGRLVNCGVHAQVGVYSPGASGESSE